MMAQRRSSWWLAVPALRQHVLPLRITYPPCPRKAATFSTTATFQMPIPGKGKGGGKQASGPPRRGERRGFRNKKAAKHTKSNPPAPGERKASKKRVVLSNVNALEVTGLEDLSEEMSLDDSLQGTILGLPGPLVDRLRAIGAFKPAQSWHMFKRPATLIRPETIAVANMMVTQQRAETVQRIILTGDRGSGKSVLLLQAQALALLKDWVVITIPEGKFYRSSPAYSLLTSAASELTSARTDYSPVPESKPTFYYQKTFTSQLLSRTLRANPILATLPLKSTHTGKLPHGQAIQTLADLCKSAEHDPEHAWMLFESFWAELTQAGRPPVLVTLDGFSHVMRKSDYRSHSFDIIHAHDLTLVRWFTELLSGATSLPNGGLVLAAMSYSHTEQKFANRTLDERLVQLEAEQHRRAGTLVHDPARDPMAAFLEATGQESTGIPKLDPHFRHDFRVFEVLGAGPEMALSAFSSPQSSILDAPSSTHNSPLPPAEPAADDSAKKKIRGRPKKVATLPEPTASDSLDATTSATVATTEPSIEPHALLVPQRTPPAILRCTGLDHASARTLMEYWARSGILRAAITSPLVTRHWALSGGGIIGELERGCLREGARMAV